MGAGVLEQLEVVDSDFAKFGRGVTLERDIGTSILELRLAIELLKTSL